MESQTAQLDRERAFARPAALAAFAAVLLYVVSVIVEQGSGLQTDGPKSEQLLSFHDNAGVLLLSTGIRAAAFLAISLPLLHLFRAARLRSERVRPEMVGFVFSARSSSPCRGSSPGRRPAPSPTTSSSGWLRARTRRRWPNA